jgi:hypothetical protein
MIQAYCEKICQNFQGLFNRWTRVSAINKFNYSAPEINRKFKYLSQKDYSDPFSSLKDYNMIVDSIMTLTGSYNSKTKGDIKPMTPPHTQPQTSQELQPQQSKVFHDLPSYDQKNIFYPQESMGPLSRQLSKNLMSGYYDEPGFVRIPSVINNLGRQPSLNNLFGGLPIIKRQGSFDFFDDSNRKKVKTDEVPATNNNAALRREDSTLKPDFGAKQGDNEDFYLPLPGLSKKNSNISDPGMDAPNLSRFNSNLSFLYDK